MLDITSIINTRINLLAVGHSSHIADYREVLNQRELEPNIYMFHKVNKFTFVSRDCIVDKEKLILKISNDAKNYNFTYDLTEFYRTYYSNGVYFSGKFEFQSSKKMIKIFLTNKNIIIMSAIDIMTNREFSPFIREKDAYEAMMPIQLETIYVGMAYGDNGNRNAFDRLSSHSTLQKIISEAYDRNWEDDILISLWDVQAANITGIKVLSGREKDGMGDVDAILNKTIGTKQLISLTEAGIIYHLQPSYNKIFKKAFPDKNAKSYSEIYFKKYDGISVEFGLDQHSIAITSNDIVLKEHDSFIRVKWLDQDIQNFFRKIIDEGDIS